MKTTRVSIAGERLPVHSLNTLIIGSGAAALNAALCLHDLGVADIAVATDRWGGGTSNNAGSDKQTYYKLSLAGELPDSAFRMAVDLFSGGSMHGDIALVEAQNSARAFYHLVELGVPFPHDAFGAYVGYKTDHDPRQRATSAGPLTSRLMFEALAREVERRGITVFDRHQVIRLLTDGHGPGRSVIGALALDLGRLARPDGPFVLFNAVNVVLGTGGPAGIYGASVYPESQLGSHGLAFEAGAVGQNLTESQFGLASTKFRWNLSGTYQQVIPRYFSTDASGHDPRDFLSEYFPDMGKLATAIFLKGYQWPFDAAKVPGFGSSLIDLLVFQETVGRGRRVFLDYLHNPAGGSRLGKFAFERLAPDALTYLERSGALLPTPLERLARMNPPAIDLYRSHGIDLAAEPLEIGLCAQHNNGGLKGDIWWESNVAHLFPVGEANGSHGVRRPGGSALNSGQVGGLRAALYISRRYAGRPQAPAAFLKRARAQAADRIALAQKMVDPGTKGKSQALEWRREIQSRMSACGAAVRSLETARKAAAEAWDFRRRLASEMKVGSVRGLPDAFRNLDLGLTHALYLEAIREYLEKDGRSRGSYLVLDPKGAAPCPGMGDAWKFSGNPRGAFVDRKILEISLGDDGAVVKRWVDVRPLPGVDGWFENVWRDYREDRIVRKERP